MPAPIKPSFNAPDVQALKQSIGKLDDAVRDVKMRDGSIDVRSLEDRIQSDPELQRGVEVIKDAFQRQETREVTGCSGPTGTRVVDVDPKNLQAGEVQTVLEALAEAKQKIAGLDSNQDGKLARSEAERSEGLTGLSGDIAAGAVSGSVNTFKAELLEWRREVTRLVVEKDSRGTFDTGLGKVAKKHARTDLGAEAILWAYRDLATQGNRMHPRYDIDDSLKEAETSFLRFVPFFRSSAFGEGHLNNREIGELFRTSDLRGFIDQKKADIQARLGGTYEAQFLAGKDLVGIEQSSDPDFQRASTGC